MFTALQDALGPSVSNWLLIVGAGVVFLAAAAVLPTLLRSRHDEDGHSPR